MPCEQRLADSECPTTEHRHTSLRKALEPMPARLGKRKGRSIWVPSWDPGTTIRIRIP